MFSQVCVCSTFGGGTLSQVCGWDGYPIPGLDGGGVPHPRYRWWEGTPSQVWMVGGVPHPRSGWWGVPCPRSGWWGGYPIPGLDGGGTLSQVWMMGVTPHPRGLPPGLPTMTGWGTPHHDWIGTPPPLLHSRRRTFLFEI